MLLNNKAIRYAILLVLMAFHFWFGMSKGWNKANTDFTNYHVSAQLLMEGKIDSCYNDVYFQQKVTEYAVGARGQFSLYPPFCAVIAIPLSGFSIMQAKRVWLCFSLGCFLLLVIVFARVAHLSLLSSAISICFFGFSLTNDLFLGQIYLFIALIITTAIYCVKKNKIMFAALAATVASLKLVTIAWLALILNKQYRKHALLLCLGVLIFNGLLIGYAGVSCYLNYFYTRLMPYLGGQVFNEIPYDYAYQSFHSLLANVLLKDALLNPFPVFESPKLYWLLITALKILSIGFIGFVLLLFKKNKIQVDAFLALLVLVIIAFEPGSASYHLLLSIPALALCMKKYEFVIRKKIIMIFLVLLTGLLPAIIDKYIAVQFNFLLLHYSRLIMATAMFSSMFYILAIKSQNAYTSKTA
ncbi:MAG: DUF2029 domain-containing protein [Bacteroidetes bacterium]|nr:DUF2029 domain-containing protein [Bacteroidota bacterium]